MPPSSLPRVVALAPSGLDDPAPVVAALRAGALGVLDLGADFRASDAAVASARIARLSGRPFGLRVPASEIQSALFRGFDPGLSILIGTEFDGDDWSRAAAEARSMGRTFVAEVTSRESARRAKLSGASALIVAGNEAGGIVGSESAFILLQAVLGLGEVPPIYVRGGIGPRSAAACIAAGASGVVLDGALLLARESPLDPAIRDRIELFDGGETRPILRGPHALCRVFAPPGSRALLGLREAAEAGGEAWIEAARSRIGWGPCQAWPVGQDAAFAPALASKFRTVAGIIQEVERALDKPIGPARSILSAGSPLARSHGTTYPIVQGPMTRVSDRPEFAAAVAEGGALPMIALALMRGPEVRTLLESTRERLGDRPWGVGILGFVPKSLREEQLGVIRAVRPGFALIAGGRPDQAKGLEAEGITTYLHVPSPQLLKQYLDDGARRFVLEGRECGGHVGPRSSLVLWEQAAALIAAKTLDRSEREAIHLLFAGGIHDSRSAAAVAALAAPIAESGVKVGLLLGTAYLFTDEAVSTGAIVPGFQAEAIACGSTVLLETGPGHEVRVSPTPFASSFDRERARLLAENRPAEEVRDALEALNTGRLRVAAKGVDRAEGPGSPIVAIPAEEQQARGVYMLGQVAALRDRTTTVTALHREISEGGRALLNRPEVATSTAPGRPPVDVAIVGMAALMPGAADVRAFWRNTLRGFDAITEVPADRWDWSLYFDPDPKAPDRITSKWGGFVPEIPFDPLRFGMPPASLPSIEPMQLLTLEVVRSAIQDAGYAYRPFPRDRTAVVLGAGGGASQLAMGYAFRSYLPLLETLAPGRGREALEAASAYLPEWTEDSFPGILLNVAAGRVANRFDLGGSNYTVDAACGSSLAAANAAVRELESGAADVVILGGADTVQNPFTYLAFSKTHAFSPRGRCRPFDASADGIVISEGIAALVLKRLADAERDGDRIYAVIKGIGSSSDGRGLGLTAPRAEGQVSALERAYANAGISPATVGYVEAHGTGTAAGDLAEISALSEVFGRAGSEPGSCGIGSVKSSIGHTKCAAGIAGLINASLALYHGVLPPTIGVAEPNPKAGIAGGPFHLSTTLRPWLHADPTFPRRAGVSAFGFGGTNFHAVLEAYEGLTSPNPPPIEDWPAELFVWKGPDRQSIRRRILHLRDSLKEPPCGHFLDYAYAVYAAEEAEGASSGGSGVVLSLVATSIQDLTSKIEIALGLLEGGENRADDPRGVHLGSIGGKERRKVAFLYPGQGAQGPDMLLELTLAFPEVRSGFEDVDRSLRALGRTPIGALVFAPEAFDEAGRESRRKALLPPTRSQPALAAACLGLTRLLSALGIEPDVRAGHSFGEIVALQAAGSFSAEALAGLAEARGAMILSAAEGDPGSMAAVAVGPAEIGAILDGLDDLAPANWNGPSQTVVSGGIEAIDRLLARARERGIAASRLPVACAFHSRRMAGARAPLATEAIAIGLKAPEGPVYSNTTAKPYPCDPARIAAQVGDQVAKPVRFAEMIEAIRADGVDLFIEVGPGSTLSNLVDSILGDRPHEAISLESAGRSGIEGLLRALARIVSRGIPIDSGRLFRGRSPRRLDPSTFRPQAAEEVVSGSTWLVNGSRARPIDGPEAPRLGVAGLSRVDLPPFDFERRPIVEVQTSSERGGMSIPPARFVPAESGRAMESFQETMRAFLDVQKATMLRYLGSGVAESPGIPASIASIGNGDGNGHAHPIGREQILSGSKPVEARSNASTARPATMQAPPSIGASRPAAEPVDGREIAETLRRIVRARTGYPAEMIGADVDLEADLGIDSIKRVEILGSLREAFPGLAIGSDPDLMEALSRAKTLGAIVSRLGERTEVRLEPGPAIGPIRPAEVAGTVPAPVRRLVLEAIEAPLPRARAKLAPGGLVLITDDGRGIGRAISADLRALGHPVVRVRHGITEGEVEGLNLGSELAVGALLDRLKAKGQISALIHLLPLRDLPAPGLDAESWAARLGPEVRGLFLLARGAADDLANSGRRGGAALIAATAMGGAFASVGEPGDFFPGQGGVAGLVKTIAREWPGVRARAVDLDPTGTVEVIAADLVREILAEDSLAEVGYRGGRRSELRTRSAPWRDLPGHPGIQVRPGEPILITGGARGITAEIAVDLAARWKPTVLIVGNSPPPPDSEDPETAGEVAPEAIKAAISRRLGASTTLPEIEKAFQALRREREIRENLRRLSAAGAIVRYAKADVRDRSELGPLLDSWRRKFGAPVGLVHGAGLILDKLLKDKATVSFDRVLGAKVGGALTLLNLIDREALRFAAFFSSIAGRYGNRGQGDYAAANEIINKLALWLDGRTPGRVVSMIWGPWKEVGMVSDLEGHLVRQGLGLISAAEGRDRLAEELARGRKGDVELVVASDLGPFEAASDLEPKAKAG